MFSRSVTVLALLSLAAGFTSGNADDTSRGGTRGKRDVPYRGPPAPLNHDGTVALTPEIQQVTAIHNAAFTHEFERLQAAENLAAAHPDRTSPPSPDYNADHNEQYNPHQQDDGQYKPYLYENEQSNKQYTLGAYNPVPISPIPYSQGSTYNHQQFGLPSYSHQSAYNSHQFPTAPYNQVSSYKPQAHVPVPLNPDGTAAQTPEYTALAASLLAAYNQALTRHRRSVSHYQGPPAPLNHDGTVALTPEIQQVTAIHNAAFAHEFERLQAAENLAAAHPDRTSPPSPDYNANHNGQYNPQQEDDGQYKPYMYENAQSNKQYISGAYNPVPISPLPYSQGTSFNHGSTNNHQKFGLPSYSYESAYNSQQFPTAPYNEVSSYKPQAQVPAPLNPDGTAAHTPEYTALAASLQAAYQQALIRHRRSISHYQGPPAPLNHDGTVANTPEVQHVIAAHKAAYAHEYQKLKEAEVFAIAHPDLTSPHYEPHSDGAYSHHQYGDEQYRSHEEDDGNYKPHLYEGRHYNGDQYQSVHYNQGTPYKYNSESHIPAPLNHDGTVAHTASYKALAASHHAEYEKAIQTAKHESITPYSLTYSSPMLGHY